MPFFFPFFGGERGHLGLDELGKAGPRDGGVVLWL
jgi:hypothetical protein